MRIFYFILLGLLVVTSVQTIGMMLPSEEDPRSGTMIKREICIPGEELKMPFFP